MECSLWIAISGRGLRRGAVGERGAEVEGLVGGGLGGSDVVVGVPLWVERRLEGRGFPPWCVCLFVSWKLGMVLGYEGYVGQWVGGSWTCRAGDE